MGFVVLVILGLVCFLSGTLYCVFFAHGSYIVEVKTEAAARVESKEPTGLIWSIVPGQKQFSTSPMPLSFCSRVRPPRMSASFNTILNVSIPSSSVDENHWVRVGDASLNIHNPSVDQYISGSLFRDGIWERSIVKAIDSLLPRSHKALFVDVGANIGYFSLYASLAGARVVSFEPMMYNIVQLQRTLLRNKPPRWTVYHNAVSEYTGDTVRLKTTDSRQNAGNHKIGPEGEAAFTVRLDDVIKENVDLMKVDVEGYEAFVLAGAPNLFCKYTVKAFILEMTQDIHSSGCNVNQMLKWIECMGYEMRSLTNPRGPRITHQGRDTNALFVLKGDRNEECCNAN